MRVQCIGAPLRSVIEGFAAGAQICASTEAAAGAGEDHGSHVVVRIGLVERIEQLDAHPFGEGVELVRAIQGDGEDAVIEIVANRFVLHLGLGSSLRS